MRKTNELLLTKDILYESNRLVQWSRGPNQKVLSPFWALGHPSMCSGSEGFLSNILEFNSHDTDRFVNKMERKRFDKCKTSFVLKLIFEQDLH